MDEAPDEAATLVALLRRLPAGARWSDVATAILVHGSAGAAWAALSAPTLFEAGDRASALADAAAEVRAWRAAGIGVHALSDRTYPAQLREVREAPPLLFTRGVLRADDRAVAVVGSRRASSEAIGWAEEISRALVDRGATVVSGLADGVDSAAHRAALGSGGRTVAVLGTGIDKSYPAHNRELQDEIAARGLVVSQFWPEAAPTKHTFPMRNATMSGYSRTTVVVGAGEKSGARIQARIAVEHGRQVILTERVTHSTTWGARLAGRPGVHVAATVDDAVDKLEEIDQMRDAVYALVMNDASV